MKYSLALATIVGTALLSQCEKSANTTAAPQAESSPSAAAPAPSVSSDLPVKEITVRADDQMRFDVTEIEVGPGQPVKLTLTNVGTMPKESMGHNLVLFTKGTDIGHVAEAGMLAAANDYIPKDMENLVIARTKLLGPGESETISFNAPSEPGDYPYFCSFPGHYAIGMKGVLTVK